MLYLANERKLAKGKDAEKDITCKRKIQKYLNLGQKKL